MVVKSQYKVDIPNCNFADLVFGSPNGPLERAHQPSFLDAKDAERRFLTRAQFRQWSKRLAAGLRAHGLQTGDRVLLFSTNNLFFPVVYMGVIMAGGIFTGANPNYSVQELSHQIKDASPRFVIALRGNTLKTASEAAANNAVPPANVFVFDDRAYESLDQPGQLGHQYWANLLASDTAGNDFMWDTLSGHQSSQRTLALNYSSGTTGLSKGVEITHKNFVSNILMMNSTNSKPNEEEARYLCYLPMYHAMAQLANIGVAQVKQAPVYIMESFDFTHTIEYIQKYRITALAMVTPIVLRFARSPESRRYDLSSVRSVTVGAAPCSREICEELEALWPNGQVNVKQGYGMTECTTATLGWRPDLMSNSISVGWPHPNSEAKIMSLPDPSDPDETNHTPVELGSYEHGEIWVRGPHIMKGYWKNPSATSATVTVDGWLKTGDVAYFDKEHKFYITGRAKELIKVNGLQVAPAELDAACLTCESVADAAVVGVTVNGKELPRAYIVLKPNFPATEETINRIKETVNGSLTKFKRITGGIVLVDALPRNPSGKILRRLLQARAQKEIEAEASLKRPQARL